MSSYGPPRADLTPADLLAAGYTVRAHICGGWCWSRRNRYGSGEVYSASYGQVEDVHANARREMDARGWRREWIQLSLLEVA